MSKIDDFDKFLNDNFEQNKNNIADEGFTEKVISNLPQHRIFSLNRTFILYVSSITAVLVFFVSSGYKALFISIVDILSSGFHLIKPSLISCFVIFVFISISFVISRIEHNENLI